MMDRSSQLDSGYRIAYDLMEKIGQQEDRPGGETARTYWLQLYEECRRVVVGGEDGPKAK